MISVFPLVSRWIDLRTLFGALTMCSRWSLIGCFVVSASIGFAGENPKDSDVTVLQEQVPSFAKDTIDSKQLADEDSTVNLKRIYGKGANGLSGFIDLETTVNSITDEIKNGKPLSADDAKKLLADLKRLTEQMSTLRSRVDQLGQSPLGRLTLLQSRLAEAKLKCVTLVSELGEDHPNVKKAVKEVDILTELIGELAEEQTSEPSRTFIISTQGRSASRLANLLGPLFAETAVISGDDDSGSMMVLVKETVPIPKVPQIQAEIKERILELKSLTQSGTVPSAARIVHQKDEKDREYELQIQKFVERYRKVENNRERAKLRSQVTELTTEQFNHRQARREREFQSLADRVSQLKAANARRLARKDEIIRRRVDELLDPSVKREWDDVDKSPEDSSVQTQVKTGAPRTYDAGELISESRPPTREEATYSGRKASEWLQILNHERNSERLQEAVDALVDLHRDVSPPILVSEIFQCIRRLKRGSGAIAVISEKTTSLFVQLVTERLLSAEEITEEIVQELERHRNLALYEFLERFLTSNAPKNPLLSTSIGKDVSAELTKSIRAKRSRLILQLVVAANEQDSMPPIVVSCAWTLFGKDSIAEWPDLVEVVHKTLRKAGDVTDSEGYSVRLAAAELLANSGINTQEAFEFIVEQMRADFRTWQWTDSPQRFYSFLPHIRSLNTLVGKRPEAEQALRELSGFVVDRIEGVLVKVRAKEDWLANYYQHFVEEIQCATELLVHVRARAVERLPQLREQLAATEMECAKDSGKRERAQPILTAVSNLIRTIETGQSIAPTVGTKQIPPSEEQSVLIDPERKREDNATPEKTYDGVGYSEWLRLLETERKPERLCAAMDAVSHLALEKDVPRIARLIFQAEAVFEQEDQNVSGPVKEAGREALRRLPAPLVFAELAAALGDGESYRSGRNFQADVIGLVHDARFTPIFKENLDEFVPLVARALNAEPDERDAKFLSSIVDVCVKCDRSPKEFPELLTRVSHLFSKGLPANTSYGHYWINIARCLVQYGSDLPDLKPVLLSQLGKNNLNVIDLLGELTLSGGPDTVPDLVEYFQLLLKKMDERILKIDRQHNDPLLAFQQGHGEMTECAQIVQVLSMVGENQLAGDFIMKLAKYVPAESEAFNVSRNSGTPMNSLFQQVESAQNVVRQFKLPSDPNRCQVQLPDFFKLNGYWKLRSDQPRSIRVHGIEWSVGDGLRDGEPVSFPISFLWSDVWGGDFPLFQPVIGIVDEEKSPKEISLIPKNGNRVNAQRIEGIYKLTEDNLVIQLARPLTPRPTKFEMADEAAKKDHVQLTFDRETTAPSFYIAPNR